jgi:uncharacterized protein YbaR (Trm112 family)/SAM-dependent methyltransferase
LKRLAIEPASRRDIWGISSMDMINELNILVGFFLFWGVYWLAKTLWRQLRLRRAFFILSRQIAWALKYAPRDKLVLDVGAGSNPHIRADVICEKFFYDDFHRGGEIATDRPLVVGDASALPFKDHIFDVIVSVHVIEHLENPTGFFAEAGRVAHSGLFIAPRAISELLYSYMFHLWTIEQKGDTLYFTGKRQAELIPPVHRFFAENVMGSKLGLDDFTLTHWSVLEIEYQWSGKPKIVVEGEPFIPEQVASTNNTKGVRHQLTGVEKLRAAIKKNVRKLMHAILSSHAHVNLLDIIACPKCHGDVVIMTHQVHCPNCKLIYPVNHGIPFMLIELATSSQRTACV